MKRVDEDAALLKKRLDEAKLTPAVFGTVKKPAWKMILGFPVYLVF
ncbi:MAG: hypothetical protein QM751_08100 [Paludibacteraceae bacterium]